MNLSWIDVIFIGCSGAIRSVIIRLVVGSFGLGDIVMDGIAEMSEFVEVDVRVVQTKAFHSFTNGAITPLRKN